MCICSGLRRVVTLLESKMSGCLLGTRDYVWFWGQTDWMRHWINGVIIKDFGKFGNLLANAAEFIAHSSSTSRLRWIRICKFSSESIHLLLFQHRLRYSRSWVIVTLHMERLLFMMTSPHITFRHIANQRARSITLVLVDEAFEQTQIASSWSHCITSACIYTFGCLTASRCCWICCWCISQFSSKLSMTLVVITCLWLACFGRQCSAI